MRHDPSTIEELKQWYISKRLPDEDITRFFIGKDYKEAKAFGIYQDEVTGNFIVYKNKSDGSRSIRYEGQNQAFAVNELYKKLKSEIYNQKYNNFRNYDRFNENYNPIEYKSINKKQIKLISPAVFIAIFMFLIISIMILLAIKLPKQGYYSYNNEYYYYQNLGWYQYDDYNSWEHIVAPEDLKENHSIYYSSYNYNYLYDIDRFEDSIYYDDPETYNDYDDDDYDYDYGDDDDYDWNSGSSWDSDYTDWDSDW